MNKKKIIALIIGVLTVVEILLGCYVTFKETGKVDVNKVEEAVNVIENTVKEVTVTEETKEIILDTKNDTLDGEDISTTETIESTPEEENEVVDEGVIEQDAKVEQENISYDGDNDGKGQALLGAYQGVTYYSQADSRWANLPYTSVGDYSQTMKSSACGPTSAAMVVSSSKGAILPTTMANLFVDNGYRTASNGTAWSAYSFVADYFGFNEYYTTSSLDTVLNYIGRDDNGDGISDYFVIASCGSGLFTTGGHYIMLADLNGATITVYDPYLYNGKFNTASRRGKVSVEGNNVYCSINNFENYANYRSFWIYSNDSGSGNTTTQPAQVSYTRYVATQSANLRVRDSAGGNIIGSLPKGTQVEVVENDGSWSRIISPVDGWVSNTYLSSTQVQSTSTQVSTVSKRYSTGTYKTTANLHVRTGASTKYRAKTYRELTANARKQNSRLGNYYYNGYKKGVVCTVTKVKGNWRIDSFRLDLS